VEITCNVFSGEFLHLSFSLSCFAILNELFSNLDHFDFFFFVIWIPMALYWFVIWYRLAG
jgi:hypothetical protein